MEIATRSKQKKYLETHPKGCKLPHRMGIFWDILKKSQKRPFCEAIYASRLQFQIFLMFLSVIFSIGYIVVYSIFFLGAFVAEKFAKQNGRFEEFLYSNVLVKYYVIQWLLEEKIFLKKPPLLAVPFKSMT